MRTPLDNCWRRALRKTGGNISQNLGIYIHWPFCSAKCPYCDFNSHVQANIDHDLWLRAYLIELKRYYSETDHRNIVSIFFGGGTPSLMKPNVIEKIINQIKILWHCDPKIEITAEANPSSSEISKFMDFRSGGINRLSIGVQSFEDRNLKFLGREHTSKDAEKAVIAASKVFDNYTFDLIYALPKQTCSEWERELKLALQFIRNHVSIYQLTIEPGTEFYKNKIEPANEKIGSDLYQITNSILAHNGYESYEISNYSKPDFNCRHNMVYWNGLDYLGVGPGAHGRLTKNYITQSIQSYKNPNKWLNTVLVEQNGEQSRLSLKPSERFEEILLMGLRLTKGISFSSFYNLTNTQLLDFIDHKKLGVLIEEDFISYDNNNLKVTYKGREILNSVLKFLLT